jgi:glycosyltransferase involved in cell wall biosynthesis
MIYVGVAAVRKGLHFALDAWLNSPASKDGEFLIVGGFVPAYQDKLASKLAHPSIKVLGHRNDVPELMRQCDIFVLPSIEEGFGLVCTEAMASGCIPLVSDACTDLCRHGENAMVHEAGNVRMLTQHITKMHEDRTILHQLQTTGLNSVPGISWTAAGLSLLAAYRSTITAK